MKLRHIPCLLAATLTFLALSANAQTRVWRCGNEYTNDAVSAQKRNCKPIEGGNVTVVQTPRYSGGSSTSTASAARSPAGSPRVEDTLQRQRDGEARTVLESELRKAEARQAELLKEYNNGEPEKQGSESRNYQKYLDRVAEMKAQVERNESDIAGIRRELQRLPPTSN
ncbi:hypothetical protein QTH91_13615 [Variovorax dokdonensis]|uniref:Uncharacterized protein n=1 Tax=Variovorax dokdonensis TaxID=344883 RepID=A0ABT7NC53_9BURK|nr:hypothetical protein [Variovorax dokdonensis]MDM0045525.1 hypothetical protein [Variovorax dokdonensis]